MKQEWISVLFFEVRFIVTFCFSFCCTTGNCFQKESPTHPSNNMKSWLETEQSRVKIITGTSVSLCSHQCRICSPTWQRTSLQASDKANDVPFWKVGTFRSEASFTLIKVMFIGSTLRCEIRCWSWSHACSIGLVSSNKAGHSVRSAVSLCSGGMTNNRNGPEDEDVVVESKSLVVRCCRFRVRCGLLWSLMI